MIFLAKYSEYPIFSSVCERNGLHVKEEYSQNGEKYFIVELKSSPCGKNHRKGDTSMCIGLRDGEYPMEEYLCNALCNFMIIAEADVFDKFSKCFKIRLEDAIKEMKKELKIEKKKAS